MKTSVGITLLSNNPQALQNRWLASYNWLLPLQNDFNIYFHFELAAPINFELVKTCKRIGSVDYHHSQLIDPCFNWIPSRERICAALPDCKYWIMTDDDMIFKERTPSGYSSWERYRDAIYYLEKNPDCGSVCCKHFLGGTPFGRKVMPAMLNCLYEMGAGLILRNIDTPWFHSNPVFDRPGALDETAAVYSRIEEGYYAARTFNCPTHKPSIHRVAPGSPDLAYDANFINSKGIGSVVRERYDDPNWDYNMRYIPKELMRRFNGHRRRTESNFSR